MGFFRSRTGAPDESGRPRKLAGVSGDGLSLSERIPLEIPASIHTRRYLKTKKEKLGHELTSV